MAEEAERPRIRITRRNSEQRERIVKVPQFIRNIAPIHGQEGEDLATEKVEEVVEKPLVEAVKMLHSLNITTTSSSANQKNIGGDGDAWVTIDFDSLSDENKRIARENLGDPYFGRPDHLGQRERHIQIIVAIDRNTTVHYVSEKALEIVKKFKPQ